ncbi:hypothetical protein [Archaeoglobus profundus]|uniref:Uncharacterized protein n=1 Tax=Archaeoglobus profundus (strain DSM 5631 / JCM 9629 / NBRC 100127 / Av18) TaxID=572546 RepID=D2REG2_ARCPA|nr:hypothetical protein [Archaeoglobus profundus]ADB58506.1 hypothetical protein Arcpr_1459 [Archaeoglobus profundus DSM 5631]
MITTKQSCCAKFLVKTRNSHAVICVTGNRFHVLECSNKDRCEKMGILNCPPYCDKISALKNYLRTGRVKGRLEIYEIDRKS